ncbi:MULTISPECIES: DUF1127 domain-containing protein [Microvirga]|uniref:DUF1127 domain-containing protein n=1 Tax=Microvirga TaxID=186650 RepID=UPI001CFFE7DE|nr:DUF1127 domain-containing protein [Microvirga lenta]MCB5175820.1 DUF1127 domain-containing protein [Microvirga lenta]
MLITLALNRFRKWLIYRETVRELDRLDDRDLTDLGIGRADIRAVARQAAQ